MIWISVDAMGGDEAPRNIVVDLGGVGAAAHTVGELRLVEVGQVDAVDAALQGLQPARDDPGRCLCAAFVT